jgi:hypothetical protein
MLVLRVPKAEALKPKQIAVNVIEAITTHLRRARCDRWRSKQRKQLVMWGGCGRAVAAIAYAHDSPRDGRRTFAYHIWVV